MNKKILTLLFCTIFTLTALAGCGQTSTDLPTASAAVAENATTTPPSEASEETDGDTAMGFPPAADTGVKKRDGSPVVDNFAFFAYQGDDALPHEFHNVDNGQTVYFTKDISPEGLLKIYQALGVDLSGKVAVKLSTGENGSNYLDPQLIKDLVQSVNGTIVECNTAYGGNRSETAMHKQLVKDHGFTEIADVDILDEEGSLEIPVTGGTYLTADYVGSHLANYDSMLVLSHFKGHPQGGFGGAIKNISIGLGSGEKGKSNIHSGGTSFDTGSMSPDINAFQCSMAEAGSAVRDYLGAENMVYISVMNHLSVDCDCVENPTAPDMHDIGILASTDPVALDQACVDLVYSADDDNASLIYRMESRNAFMSLKHADEIGLGSRDYTLVDIDG